MVITARTKEFKRRHCFYKFKEILGRSAQVVFTYCAKAFCEVFEEMLMDDAEGIFTFFVSPNGYHEFERLMMMCKENGMEFAWFYPVLPSDEPEVSKLLEENLHIIRLK